MFFLLASLTFPMITSAGDLSPQGELKNKGDNPAIGDKKENAWVNIKDSKPITIDKENLEKNKNIVKVYEEYWKAITERDFKKAYSMECMDYQKMVSYDLYVERCKKMINIKTVEPVEVKQLSEKEVMVRGLMRYQTDVIDSIRTFEDRWVHEDGTLRHVRDKEKGQKNSLTKG